MTRFAAIILTLMVWSAPEVIALQAGRAAVPTTGANRACSMLTKERITKVSPYDAKTLATVLLVPANGSSIGASGSECTYGGITMQIDPFTPAAFDRIRTKDWTMIPNLGDSAYYRDNGGRWGEIFASSGAHVLTIQMDIPTGRTAASIQPNAIALAKEILPNLK